MGCRGSASNYFDHIQRFRNALLQTSGPILVCPGRAVGGRFISTRSAVGDQAGQLTSPLAAIGGGLSGDLQAVVTLR